ncbi:MAG: MSMEG_0568 family radical SAM protein [Desulfovibrionaceae bacterium]|nr:MSMEG_0568 family radical SAM protein [Desulfovibrionaceae bacterium]
MKTDLLRTYIELQVRGVRCSALEPGRRGGAGPCGTRAFLFGDRCVMLPVNMPGVETPFTIEREDGRLHIARDGERLLETALVPAPRFQQLTTADGLPYRSIALLHGRDCLASTVMQQCARYADEAKRCRFCALGQSLKSGATIARKTPEMLAEVAVAARDLDNVRHVTLTSGTTARRDTGIRYLGRCADAIWRASGLPVQIQFEPPEDRAVFRELKEMHAANVAMHVESLDESVRALLTPGKAEISLDTYFSAFEDAVAVFGRNRVNTYVILGLGEDRQITLDRCRELVRMGVYPNLVPLHPLPGTPLAGAAVPDIDYLYEMYTEIGEVLREERLNSARCAGGCGRCRACSLLQFTERGKEHAVLPHAHAGDGEDIVTITVARTPEDLAACHAVRQAVFVQEQGLFEEDDADSHDGDAIHILARVNGEPAGVVRCYRESGSIWYGGRLAVLRGYRSGLGADLVRKAVETMQALGTVERFYAKVQIQNVRFFRRLHWVCVGEPFLYSGVRHQLMERPLEPREQRQSGRSAA